MEEGTYILILFGLCLIILQIIFLILINYEDYVICKRCGKWHDIYDVDCVEKTKP